MRHTTTVTLTCQHADCQDGLQLTAQTLHEAVRDIDLRCALREAALWLDWRYDVAADKVYCGLHAKDLCCSRCLVRRDDCFCMGGPTWTATSAVKPDDDDDDEVSMPPVTIASVDQLLNDPNYHTIASPQLAGPIPAFTHGRAIPICRRCSECVGQNHHWMENDVDGEDDDWFVCKHCNATCPEKDPDEGFPEPDESRIHYPKASR